MNSGRNVFAQLIEHLPHRQFQKCVVRYCGDRYAKNFSCWDQYLAMAFAQLTYRESLRDPRRLRTSWRPACTRFYRFSALRSSRKRPFYAPFRPSMRTPISPKTPTN
jgi:hypothetical protein